MKRLNTAKQIKYLGFDDFWFIIIGSIATSFITDYLFNGGSFFVYPFYEALVNWSISLFFSVCNWFITRAVMIFLRKKFPAFKDHLKRIFIFCLTITATILFIDRIGELLLSNVIGTSYNHGDRSFILVPIFIISIMIIAIYEAIYFYHQLKKSVQEEEQSKQVLIQSQLDALRNQAQPHFLFNSLNTLRDIIDQDSKEDAKQFVNKLSEVYKFILESGNANLITLREEIRFAKAYMHIQSERFGTNLRISWQMDESSLDSLVVPMSLQMLLENAIKHNVISRSNPLDIIIRSKANQLIVENALQPKSTQVASTQLGLKNITKSYALLSETSVQVENTNRQFIVTLPLLKSSHKTKTYEHTDS